MTLLSKEQADSREKTLLVALLLSVPGPLVVGLAAASSQSSTQLADFIRRSVELVALFLSWWVFHQVQRNATLAEADRSRMERAAGLGVAAAMIISGIVMAIVALSNGFQFEPGGKVIAGLTIALLGFLTNGWFWRRYTKLTREEYSAITAAQQKLYRAKTSVDLCVVLALTAVALAPAHPATPYVDLLGSIGVAAYLLWSGLRMAQSHLGDIRGQLQGSRRHLSRISWLQIRKDNE